MVFLLMVMLSNIQLSQLVVLISQVCPWLFKYTFSSAWILLAGLHWSAEYNQRCKAGSRICDSYLGIQSLSRGSHVWRKIIRLRSQRFDWGFGKDRPLLSVCTWPSNSNSHWRPRTNQKVLFSQGCKSEAKRSPHGKSWAKTGFWPEFK